MPLNPFAFCRTPHSHTFHHSFSLFDLYFLDCLAKFDEGDEIFIATVNRSIDCWTNTSVNNFASYIDVFKYICLLLTSYFLIHVRHFASKKWAFLDVFNV
jgi:hypothetical protein